MNTTYVHVLTLIQIIIFTFLCQSLNEFLQLFCGLSLHKLQILVTARHVNFHVQST